MRIARLHHFDAVILDIEMPEMSGYAVAQELRTLYYATRAPLLIAISGKWTRPCSRRPSASITTSKSRVTRIGCCGS